MVDIHAHVLPFVDDGSKSLEQSLRMVKEAVLQGVTDMILTPHFDKEYKPSHETLKQALDAFAKEVKKAGVQINLYLGQEIYINGEFKKLISSGQVLPLNGTEFLLIEFDSHEDFDIAEAVYQLKTMGYKPIVAHFERYAYADISVAEEVKAVGGYIQVNADSLVGKYKIHFARKVKNLFKEGLVDFVASDIHAFRKNYTKKARELITKKFGEKTARAVFSENALKIIKG